MKKLTILCVLFALSLSGQKAPTELLYQAADVFFIQENLQTGASNIPEGDLPGYIHGQAGYDQNITLQLYHKISSKTLTHYRYHLLKDGIQIFNAEVHIAIDKNGKVRLLEAPALPDFSGGLNFPAVEIAEDVKYQNGAENIVRADQVWYTDNSDFLRRGLVVELAGPETLHQEILINSSNRIISQSDLHRYFDGPNDSVVSVKVFTPDPLTTANQSYGSPYVDSGDVSVPVLEAQRKTKSLTLAFENGEFVAKNDFVKILDFSAPNINPVTSTSDQMHYTRDQAGFEDMNVMYHITNHKQHLINLGFSNLPNYTIEVDPHAINGADQSFFSTSSNPGRLYFGEGGVDDAEDADVIIHEYSHAVIYEAAPATNISTERGCIEEALGDYFAASYSNTIDDFNGNKVFNWDGHNEFWPGRKVESTKDYVQEKSSFKNGNYYTHTDLFASPLMEIYKTLGRNTSDEIILEAIFNLGKNTTMLEMAGYIILADSLLNGGANYQVIITAFARRNIMPTISVQKYDLVKADIQVYNTLGFAAGGPVKIRTKNYQLDSYTIYSMNGALVATGGLNAGEREQEVDAPQLVNGAYLLTLSTTSGEEVSYKLIRAK